MDGTIPFMDSFVYLAYCKTRSEIEAVYIHGFARLSRSGLEHSYFSTIPRSFDVVDQARTPKVDLPKFHGEKSQTVETRCEHKFEMYLLSMCGLRFLHGSTKQTIGTIYFLI
jgi:hypothetical protein